MSVVKGLENIEKLQEQAKEELPDITVKLLPIDLPSGWKFRDLKHGHLLDFYDAEPFSQKYKSKFAEADAQVRAAIAADFFELPTAVNPDVLRGMEWADVEKLQLAVVNCVLNKSRTPKN